MSHPTISPYVKLAVGAVRCLNPDMITEHGNEGVRAALDLWSWRRELSDDDVEQAVAELAGRPAESRYVDFPPEQVKRGVRYGEVTDDGHLPEGEQRSARTV